MGTYASACPSTSTNPAAESNRFYAIWRQVAAHYAHAPPGLAFELINEPKDAATTLVLNPIYAQAIRLIRQSNPKRTLFVGRSSRTNEAGVEQLQSLLAPFDYRVIPVEFTGCLHLKSAVTRIADELLLANPDWVSSSPFRPLEAIPVDAREPYGANALRIAGTVVYPAQFPRTRDRMVERGLGVVSLDCSELAKAEGAVTCCSLVFQDGKPLARPE